MCDLIDLNSSDVRGALEPAKLASPLIPAPKNIECDDGTNLELVTEKRESDGNNPFDQVLHETVEYVNKKGDPFEVMLQRALRSKSLRNAQSVDFTDDFTPRKKRYFKTMNKTFGMLDESFKSRFGLFNRDKKEAKIKTRSVGIDMRNADICDSDTADSVCLSKQEHKISIVASDSLELSILNQSAMNDTLLEGFPKSKESDKVSLFLEKDMAFEESVFPSNVKHLKLSDTQRSLSQGKSPTELLYQNRRSQSVTEDKRKVLQSDNSTISSFLDRGFMESRSEQSVLSSLSNISSITKLTSASLSSSILSNDPMNHAFLDNSSLKMSQDKMSTTENSMEMKLKQYDLSDLAERFNKLKCIMNNTTNISSITEEDSNSMKEENIKRIANNKLIDVDVFVPEQNKEFNRSSSSTCSSDSVFTNTSKIDKSILKEAKVLAKTFEELTSKTDSGSIEDDFISNNTLWMSELLPAFEDEPVVNDLIDLPVSPERNLKDIKNSDTKQSPASVDSAEENIFKEMESPFTNSSVVKQNITSLLLDLRKLVKESNPKAKKLLDDLENILDINYKNNTELLVTCFNTSNKSQSSLKISSESIERFNKSSTGKSEEKEDSKILFSEKLCSDEKSLPDINTLRDTSPDIVSIEKSLNMSLSCKDNSEDCMSTSNLSEHSKQKVKKSKEKDNQVDKKVAIELLINLKKLLSGQAEKTALNSTENEMQANYIEKQNIQQTTPVRNRQESSRNVHSSTLSTKMVHRRSLESKSKKIDRRSISAIESSPKNTQVCRRKNTSESENRQKRFSSDPGFINNLSNKKLMPEAYNSRKAEVAKSDSGKEKSIAISDVKNKLKKRSDVINKRGPMKAVHPLDNIQKRRASFGRQAPSSQITTPPKSDKAIPSDNKIISSTPNSTDNYYMPKKPSKSKPIASSTPDGQNSKSVPLISANKKRNLSCDISPVTTHVNMLNSDEQKNSPKRMSKLPTPKKCTTPTRQQTDGIPRFLTPPRHYSFNTNNLQSPQRLNKSLISFQRYSPANEKNVGKTIQQSPLKETNRITPKVKPFNLVSKIKRHSISNFAEKENNYVRD
ncbi:PREDICTED: LOW QUALITY PROTEIN: uncharacterized protein LOC105146012 [Acromyrmex echinatior]|uniref:LOW QUALITY PROTEIN: uncharacterized protein LOC105146012 n=1 Tax=Acromyrmex echinatior TaxID=103372 RepID=UPI000580CC7B|nr:PREDICTED: LOW QUALITY PROTEIN: uncharacterized protein LOC105146012 [Acromyrmex echinatior]